MNLRSVLTRYHIEWRDRGPNCSRGWVNVKCPLCGNADPSFHCRISEQLTSWYCLRNSRHSGSGVGYLFFKLKIPKELVPNPNTTSIYTQDQPETTEKIDYSAWAIWSSASLYPEAVAYLTDRKFSLPLEVIQRFNLKAVSEGKWAKRILCPLTVGWTGRTWTSYLQPRYLAHTDERGFFLYGQGETAIIVEGPIDAMKLATAVPSGFTYIAMTSGYISPAIQYLLRERQIQTVYSVPDDNVELTQRMEMLQTLRSTLPFSRVIDVKFPDWARSQGYKDTGEMSEDEARQFIYSLK